MNPTDAAAALPLPGATPEPQGAPAAAPEAGGGAFAAILAALAGAGPPPTLGPQAEARTAVAGGTEAGSDSPGPIEIPDPHGAVSAPVILEGSPAGSVLSAGLLAASVAPIVAQPTARPVEDAPGVQVSEAPHSSVDAGLLNAAPTDPALLPTPAPDAGPVQAARHVDDLAIDHDVVAPTRAPAPTAETRARVRFDREQPVGDAPVPVEPPLAEPARPFVSPAKPVAQVDPEWIPGSDPPLRVEQTSSASTGRHGSSGFERQLYEDTELGEPFRRPGQTVSIAGGVPIGGAVPDSGGLVVSLDGPAAAEPVAARRPSTSRVNELFETTRTAIRVAVRNGQSEARITLRPAELGEVRIALRYESGGVSAALTADSAPAFEALAQAATELRRGLEQQGVSVLGLEVRMSGDETQREASLWQDGTPSADPYDELFGEDESQDEASELDDPGDESGGIDVFA